MRRVALSAVLVVVAGCGGSKHAGKIALQLSGPPSSPSCDKKGISTRAALEGSCVVRQTAITVANRGHSLAMKNYAVGVVGVRTAANAGGRVAQNFTPGGQFVVVAVRVRNTAAKPLRFDGSSNLVFLLVDGTEYLEIPGAEAQLRDSFQAPGRAVRPGRVVTGIVVFDPPAKHAKGVGAKGSYVVFLNAEDAGNGFPRVGTRAIGFIRLWK